MSKVVDKVVELINKSKELKQMQLPMSMKMIEINPELSVLLGEGKIYYKGNLIEKYEPQSDSDQKIHAALENYKKRLEQAEDRKKSKLIKEFLKK